VAPRNRILIVEDEANLQRLWATALAQEGFLVDVAGDGLDAYTQVLNELPDVIVLDLGLPGVRGDALLQDFRNNRRTAGIPVIVVTGETPAPGLDAHSVLRKPIQIQALVNAVRSCLR
jgi:DNA-binding response OmpR family regulator